MALALEYAFNEKSTIFIRSYKTLQKQSHWLVKLPKFQLDQEKNVNFLLITYLNAIFYYSVFIFPTNQAWTLSDPDPGWSLIRMLIPFSWPVVSTDLLLIAPLSHQHDTQLPLTHIVSTWSWTNGLQQQKYIQGRQHWTWK